MESSCPSTSICLCIVSTLEGFPGLNLNAASCHALDCHHLGPCHHHRLPGLWSTVSLPFSLPLLLSLASDRTFFLNVSSEPMLRTLQCLPIFLRINVKIVIVAYEALYNPALLPLNSSTITLLLAPGAWALTAFLLFLEHTAHIPHWNLFLAGPWTWMLFLRGPRSFPHFLHSSAGILS